MLIFSLGIKVCCNEMNSHLNVAQSSPTEGEAPLQYRPLSTENRFICNVKCIWCIKWKNKNNQQQNKANNPAKANTPKLSSVFKAIGSCDDTHRLCSLKQNRNEMLALWSGTCQYPKSALTHIYQMNCIHF